MSFILRRDTFFDSSIIMLSIFHRMRILKNAWRRWRLLKKIVRAKGIVVYKKFSGSILLNRSWKAWKVAFERSRRKEVYQIQIAMPQGREKIYRYFWKKWLDYVHEARLEREVSYRSAVTWSKVQSWLQNQY